MKTESLIDLLEINDNKYENVNEIVLNRFDIAGEIVEVDFNDLSYFFELEKLTLVNLSLGDELIYILYNLKKLKTLSLINCDINFGLDVFNELKIVNLTLDNSKMDVSSLDKRFELLEIRNMTIDCSNIKADKFIINNSKIKIEKINFENIKTLVISNTQYNKTTIFNESLPVSIIVVDDDSDEVIYHYEKD